MYFKSFLRIASAESRCIGHKECVYTNYRMSAFACMMHANSRHFSSNYSSKVTVISEILRSHCMNFRKPVNRSRVCLLPARSSCELSALRSSMSTESVSTLELRGSIVKCGQCSSCYSTSARNREDGRGPDFTALAKEALDAAKKRNVMAGSVPVIKVKTLLKDLHDLGLPLDRMVEALSPQLNLLQDPDTVKSLSELLISQGLTTDAVIDVFQIMPILEGETTLKNIHKTIMSSLEQLRILGFTDKDLQYFITAEPRILFVDSKTCQRILKNLKGLFKNADALFVLKSSPNVLYDSWKLTNEKFDYCYFTMGYKQQEIIKSRVFRHDLEHIQDRHIFLVRAGLFHPVREKDDVTTNPNPPLSAVVDTVNAVFVRDFKVVTLNEYEAYLRMREVEREEEDLSDENEESDDDDESEEEQEVKKRGKKPNLRKR